MLTITNHGSIILVRPDPADATWFWEWADDNLPSFQSWAGALVVEPRYLAVLLDAISDDTEV